MRDKRAADRQRDKNTNRQTEKQTNQHKTRHDRQNRSLLKKGGARHRKKITFNIERRHKKRKIVVFI